MDKTYTLYADDEMIAENLTMNGNNYVSIEEVDVSELPLSFKFTAKDNDGNTTEEFEHAKLLQQEQYEWDDNKYYLAFAPVSQQEVDFDNFSSNLQYLAMMSDIDIDV